MDFPTARSTALKTISAFAEKIYWDWRIEIEHVTERRAIELPVREASRAALRREIPERPHRGRERTAVDVPEAQAG